MFLQELVCFCFSSKEEKKRRKSFSQSSSGFYKFLQCFKFHFVRTFFRQKIGFYRGSIERSAIVGDSPQIFSSSHLHSIAQHAMEGSSLQVSLRFIFTQSHTRLEGVREEIIKPWVRCWLPSPNGCWNDFVERETFLFQVLLKSYKKRHHLCKSKHFMSCANLRRGWF